ncbi:MAG: Mu transposase C-terminal domain-containing protein [Planctomycetes bacterium]|nr:Mu transposase C-terminal domain-containing protein [Planctomycetota bacterium]
MPLAKKLPTYMGADMDPQAKLLAFKRTRATGQGLLSWDDFLSLARQAVEAKNNKGHSALPKIRDAITGKPRRQTPLEAWTAFVSQGWVPEVPADHALFVPRLMRTVRRCEVSLPWGRYFSRDLEEWHGRPVAVAYDIHDGAKVSVYDPEGPLLASAGRQANDQPYFPESRLEHARDQRKSARLRRLDSKTQEIEAEAGLPVPPAPAPEPAHEGLESLLTAPQTIQAKPAPEPLPETPPSGAAVPKAGEAGVIDALIEKAADTREEGNEG